jgi:hypothetical protein
MDKKFTHTYADGQPHYLDFCQAMARAALLPAEFSRLDVLEIGETLVDEDGDTWERIA